jgi:hypothetical protein
VIKTYINVLISIIEKRWPMQDYRAMRLSKCSHKMTEISYAGTSGERQKVSVDTW